VFDNDSACIPTVVEGSAAETGRDVGGEKLIQSVKGSPSASANDQCKQLVGLGVQRRCNGTDPLHCHESGDKRSRHASV